MVANANGRATRPIDTLELVPEDVVCWPPYDHMLKLHLELFGMRAVASEAIATLNTIAAVAGRKDGRVEFTVKDRHGDTTTTVILQSSVGGRYFRDGEAARELRKAEPAEERARRRLKNSEEGDGALAQVIQGVEKVFAAIGKFVGEA